MPDEVWYFTLCDESVYLQWQHIIVQYKNKISMLMTMSKVIACGGVDHFHRTYKNLMANEKMTLHEKTEERLHRMLLIV